MRIAWTGEPGSAGAGGVPGIAHQLLTTLASRGHTVDVFFPLIDRTPPPPSGETVAGLQLHPIKTGWNWKRWYARPPFRLFLSVSAVRSVQTFIVVKSVMRAHRRRPFDVIFQMSQIEHAFPRRSSRRPPLVLHPCTLARQEAAWHWRERRLALSGESRLRFAAIQAVLTARSWLQPRSAQAADLVVGPSSRFGQLAAETLRLDPAEVRTLRHPVDITRFKPSSEMSRRQPYLLLFVGYVSARKGIDLIVDLSHRLDDLAGDVLITVVGGPRLWSDYSHLLDQANPRLLQQAGPKWPAEVLPIMQQADAVIVPSRFEPGSIVTGEALACGVPVIASDAVGPSEILDDTCGRVFADGDAASLEEATRDLLATLAADRGAFRAAARARALEHLATDTVVDQLEALLAEAIEGQACRGRD
jgi:glycosyltransferase involved in cell wall biosynthesis